MRGRSFNLLTNVEIAEDDWLSSFGDQRKTFEPVYQPVVEKIHNEKELISSQYNKDDAENEPKRFKFEYMPKNKSTHQTSIRFANIPKDNGIF